MPGAQDGVHLAKIFLGIHAHRVLGSLVYIERKAVFKQSQLFQAFYPFQDSRPHGRETIERGVAVRI